MNTLIDALNGAGQSFFQVLLPSVWQATLVAIVLLAIVAMLHRFPASLRYGLLLIALAKFAVPAVWPAPWSLFSLLSLGTPTESLELAIAPEPNEQRLSHRGASAPARTAPPAPDPQLTSADPDQLPGGARAGDRAADVALRELVQWSPHDTGIATDQAVPITKAVPRPQRLHLAAWGLMLQLLGMAAMGAWLLLQTVRLRRMLSRARPASKGEQKQLDEIACQLGLRKRPRLLISDACGSPFAAGLWRPVIVLPAPSFAQLNETEVRCVLGHEVMHLRRGDLWGNWLQWLVRCVWWWHPLVWYLHRRLNSVREDCCDDSLLARHWIDADHYCETLLKVARCGVIPRSTVGAVSMAASHPLARRLRRIMDPGIGRPRRLSRGWVGLLLAAAIGILPGAPLASEPPSERPAVAGNAIEQQILNSSSEQPGTQSHIQIIDADDRPLAGVQLAISSIRTFSPSWIGPQILWAEETGADGYPHSPPPNGFDEHEPVREEALWVYSRDYGITVIGISDLQQLALPERVSRGAASAITLRVLDAEQRPAVGTEVRLRVVEQATSWYRVPDPIADVLVVVVDADGRVQLPVVHHGAINSIELRTPDGASEQLTLQVGANDSSQESRWPEEVVLGPTGRVSGRVRDVSAGETHGMRVLLMSGTLGTLPDADQVIHTRYTEVSVDADGTFFAPAVPIGQLGGIIYRDEQWLGRVAAGEVVTAGEETKMELDLAKLVAVHFPVVDAEDGTPIEATVLATFEGVGTSAAPLDGAPPVLLLPAGAHYTFSLHLPDTYVPFPWHTLRVAVPQESSSFTAPAVKGRRSGQVTGRVLHSDGQPAVGASVVASWPPDPQQAYSQPGRFVSAVDPTGAFELKVPKDSPLDIKVMREQSSLTSQLQVLWESLQAEGLLFTVPPPEQVAIAGRVVDGDGKPLGGVAVNIERFYTDGVNTFSSDSIYSGVTDAAGRYQTPVDFPRHAGYRVKLADSEAERWQAQAVGIRDRDDAQVTMEDLRLRPATAKQPLVPTSSPAPATQTPMLLNITVRAADGNLAEAARVVVWSAGRRTRLSTDATGRVSLPVRSSAWVIAGGIQDADYIGTFVEDPSRPLELRLPIRGEATPRTFASRSLPEQLKTRVVTSLEQFTRRALDQGSEFQGQQALEALAVVAPEAAIALASDRGAALSGPVRERLAYQAAPRLAAAAPQRARELAAGIESSSLRAVAQAVLAGQLPEQLAQQQAQTAIESARAIADPVIRGEAMVEVAKRLRRSAGAEFADQLVGEALPLLPEADQHDRARYRRGAFAVQLGFSDLAAAERLLLRDDGVSGAKYAFNWPRAELAEQLADRAPAEAERLVLQLAPRYRDQHLPRVVYSMARIDLLRSERLAEMMSGPGGQTFAQVAIAAALVEDDPAAARARLLAALDRLEALADRGWRTGEDDYQLIKVGVTLLPWLAIVAPDRIGDSFWRVLALRHSLAHGTVESRLGPHGDNGELRTTDPVLAAFVSHFDTRLARLLLLPPDDTPLRGDGIPAFFFGALAAVDPEAALAAIEAFAQRAPEDIDRLAEAWEQLAAVLSRDGTQRWRWIQHSQYQLRFN